MIKINEHFCKFLISRIISKHFILLFFANIMCINQINSYLIFPLNYLNDKYYTFIKDNPKNSHERIMQEIYFKNFITKIQIGTPSKSYSVLLDSNNEDYYITSLINSTRNKESKNLNNLFYFNDKDYFNENLSSTYKKILTYHVYHGYENSKEICLSSEKFIFNKDKNNKNDLSIHSTFPVKLERITDKNNIPGIIGILYNNAYNEFQIGDNFIIELKKAKLIDNHYWFFNFDKISPLKKSLKGQFIIGSLPHEIFPEKFSDFIYTNSYKMFLGIDAWTIYIDKVYISNNSNTFMFERTNMVLSYEMYNIIGNLDFHIKIKEDFMNKLLEEKKCFMGKFSEYKNFISNMTFYYCYKSIKNILYENLSRIKFESVSLGFYFEFEKEELFYIKGDYIYFMVLFNSWEYNYWIMGQMLTTKYNFVFNTDNRQIGLYKKVNIIENNEIEKNNYNINKILFIFIIISIIFFFSCIGLYLLRKIFCLRKKILVNELIEERDYDYKTHNDKIKSNYNSNGNKKKTDIMIEMNKKIDS